jgi:hypothetical protein
MRLIKILKLFFKIWNILLIKTVEYIRPNRWPKQKRRIKMSKVKKAFERMQQITEKYLDIMTKVIIINIPDFSHEEGHNVNDLVSKVLDYIEANTLASAPKIKVENGCYQIKVLADKNSEYEEMMAAYICNSLNDAIYYNFGSDTDKYMLSYEVKEVLFA